MDLQELKLQVATTIESIAAIDRELSVLASSLLAIHSALTDASPDQFAKAYGKHFSGPDCEKVRQSHLRNAESLLASAQLLRQSH